MFQHPIRPWASQARSDVDENSANVTTVQFVQGSWAPDQRPKGPSKLYHKKSRNGCQRCKARRVKCDENHPTCGNCMRHKEACLFKDDGVKLQIENRKSNRARNNFSVSGESPGSSSTNRNVPNIPESRGRRLLELELLHHYNTKTSQTLLVSGDPTAAEAWIRAAPNLAFGNEALLYSIFSLSACHMAEIYPQRREETLSTHQSYLELALHRHSDDVTNLSEKSFDAVCIASSMLRITAFVILRDRPLNPYTPPVSWLQMTRGAMDVFKAASKWMRNDEGSIASRLTKRMPVVFDNEAKFAISNRQGLLHLLERDQEDVTKERWHPEDQEAYETTISYIGGTWIAMKGAETSAEICRRLILFPFLIQSRFIDLIKDQQPRALAVLAHYFALLASFQNVWWIGHTGRREVQALATILSGKWQHLMSWPLNIMEEKTLHTSYE